MYVTNHKFDVLSLVPAVIEVANSKRDATKEKDSQPSLRLKVSNIQGVYKLRGVNFGG